MKSEKYYEGKPCKRLGHTLRFKSSGSCVECTRIDERKRNLIRKNDPKHIEYNINYRKKNKGKIKNYNQIYKYGITYDEKLKEQNFKCAICEDKLDLAKKTHIDHKGNKVRGILCHLCNIGLGHFRDNEEFLLNAINYLKKNKPLAE